MVGARVVGPGGGRHPGDGVQALAVALGASGGIVTLRGYSTFSWYKLGQSSGAVQHLLAFSHLSLLQQVTTQQIKRFNLRGHPVGLL